MCAEFLIKLAIGIFYYAIGTVFDEVTHNNHGFLIGWCVGIMAITCLNILNVLVFHVPS